MQEWQKVEREWQQRLSVECPGPFLIVGDEVSAVGPDEPTVISVPGSTLRFQRRKSVPGQKETTLVASTAELVLDGDCLRHGYGNEDRPGPSISWPAGFTPHIEDGEVEIRNGAGRTIVRVGDMLQLVGHVESDVANLHSERCPGGIWFVGIMKNLTRPIQGSE